MKELSRIASAVQASTTMAIDAMFKQMKADGVDVIGFGAGEPDFNTPDNIKAAGIAAIEQNVTRYTPAAGTVELRQAVCGRMKADYGLEYKPSQVVVSSGAKHLVYLALRAVVNPGDEVILPSFTFSSTATAAVLAGAKLVFVDIRPDTMNIDETKIEQAITDKTRVIIAMHYAGVACEMDTIMDIARRHDLKVVEDAAQGVMSSYKGKALGTDR